MTDFELVFNKIKPIIAEAKTFGIIAEKNPEEYKFLAQEALKTTLQDQGFKVFSILEETNHLYRKWATILDIKQTDFPKKTALYLPKEKLQIKEVSYKEEGDSIAFIITSGETLEQNSVLVKPLPPEPEVLFCLFKEKEKLNYFQNKIKIPEKEKIIFITSDEKLLTEKIFDIIKIFDPNILLNEKTSSILLAALIKETNYFLESFNKESLSLASLFLEYSKQKEKIFEILEKEKKDLPIQLLGRIMARTYIDEASKTSWSFLNRRDFQKTNQSISLSPPALYKLIKKIKYLIPKQNFHILIWQTQEGIKCLIALGRKELNSSFQSLAASIGTKPESCFLVAGPFKNFSEAEIKIKQEIKKL